jgi:hypothetical protein
MFWVALLIVHGLLAVALLGALTHQAVSVVWPRARKRGFVERFAAVPSSAYATAVVVLYIATFVFGAWIYANYRVDVKPALEDLRAWVHVGLFEIKEHVAALGLFALPLYWVLWRRVGAEHSGTTRAAVTVVLAAATWWSFLVGHVLNNARGIGT